MQLKDLEKKYGVDFGNDSEMEALGFNLTAMRESIASKDEGEFVIDPNKMAGHPLEPQSPGDSFSPELIVEPVVVFEG